MHEIKRNKIWSLLYTPGDAERDEAIREIAERTGLSAKCACLIYNRGFRTADDAERFLRNEEAVLHDPRQLKDMDRALERIRVAVENKETIAIYGDYDVDGVTSVSMLYLYLKSLDAGRIEYYIPSRDGEGYGLSSAAIDRLKEKGVELIITVDTGITANEEAAYASSLGIDMVVTDHHECRPDLPDCCAVVNPHREDSEYPFRELAGVGVVFKLVCAYEMMLCRERGEPEIDGVRKICYEYGDLVAIGTIADVMPIVDENRLIVKLGLKMIEKTRRPGLAALIEAVNAPSSTSAAPKKRKITSSFIGYGIAPRINAAGRIDSATKAVRLLLAEDPASAKNYAQELCEINRQRQAEENRIAEQAMKKIEKGFDPENDRVIVIEDDGWKQGIIGIVASRITERYGLPSLLISFDGATRGYPSPDDIGKGSGRSVKGMNLVNAMNSCDDLLCKYGGHELAAGLTIERDKIPEFTRRINEYAKNVLTEDKLNICLEADCELDMRDINMHFAQEILMLEPFGVANPVPQFVLRGVNVNRIIQISGGKHMKLIVEKDGIQLTAICFGMSEAKTDINEGEQADLLFTVDINDFQNVRNVQLIVHDCKPSSSVAENLRSGAARFDAVRAGESFTHDDDFVPDRSDCEKVYLLLRREARNGKTVMSLRRILSLLERNGHGRRINYVKLRFILLIFYELKICGVEQIGDDVYEFDMYFNGSKTSIDKSSILRKLKSQCKG